MCCKLEKSNHVRSVKLLLYFYYRFSIIIAVTAAIFLEFLPTIQSKDLADRTVYLDRWKNAIVNIAIMGNAAVGKSTFINKIRDIKKGEAGYAKVGGTTTLPTPYAMPNNEKIVFWDTPSLDTPGFQLNDSLFDKWDVDKYDYILLFYATSFHMSEIRLTKMLKARGKNVAFVRTKIDELLHEDHDLNFVENIQKIKTDGQAILREHEIGNDVRLFAISNDMLHLGDYDKLVIHIMNSLNSLKQESMILSLGSFSERIINLKKTKHLNDVWKVCMAVGTVNGLPLPIINVQIYAGFLHSFVNTYLESFKLDPASLEKLPMEIKSQLKLSATMSTVGVIPFLTKELGKRLAGKAGHAQPEKLLKMFWK